MAHVDQHAVVTRLRKQKAGFLLLRADQSKSADGAVISMIGEFPDCA